MFFTGVLARVISPMRRKAYKAVKYMAFIKTIRKYEKCKCSNDLIKDFKMECVIGNLKSDFAVVFTPSKQSLGKISEDILHRALSASSISSYQRTLKFYQQFLRLYFPVDPVVPITIEHVLNDFPSILLL
jgi:hypothetical protein